MTRILCLTFWLSLLASTGAFAGTTTSFTFFEGTQYPLKVYFLRGNTPGPTVYVQGGIQGDEPSGWLAAQLLTSSDIRRGNLVVVPRANVPSIRAHKRQINVDMNRRFDKHYDKYYEDRTARVIRFLLASCDAMIHLHEGSGFYSPTYINAGRNPNRYGQSVIIDTAARGKLNLAGTVEDVLGRLNGAIVPADYRFTLFNTKTFDSDTPYPEQRKSLTYYAMSVLGIPALAIETSKSIKRLGWKVNQQLKATSLFLSRFGVEMLPPMHSDDKVDKLLSDYGQVMVGGKAVQPGKTKTIRVAPFSAVPIKRKAPRTPFEPVVSVSASSMPEVDLPDGNLRALMPKMRLDIDRDGLSVGRVNVVWKQQPKKAGDRTPPLFMCLLNGEPVFVPSGNTLEAVAGDSLVMLGVWNGYENEVLNFKGIVTALGKNDGRDNGSEIILDPECIMSRYMKRDKDGSHTCRIARETPGATRGEFFVHIAHREVRSLVLRSKDGLQHVPVAFGKSEHPYPLAPGEYSVVDAWSNGGLTMTVGAMPLAFGESFTLRPGDRPIITLRQSGTFKPIGDVVLVTPNS